MINYDYELEKQAHPENFRFSEDDEIEEYREDSEDGITPYEGEDE